MIDELLLVDGHDEGMAKAVTGRAVGVGAIGCPPEPRRAMTEKG
jgi:hypothetical protein